MASHPSDRDRDGRLVLIGGGTSGALGRVILVGAGPGDPELLTLKAAKALAAADVVVHDRLVSAEVLAMARTARKVYVGKRKSRHSVPQDGINTLLVALALEGLNVVRLKGGDPFLFGRGGEEMLACREAGVACEVIPGITAAMAASALAGAPLTHRGLAQSVTFVTAHSASGGEPDLDWSQLSKGNQTLAIYMGVSTAGTVAARLIAAGRSPSTPVLVVENASLQNERRISTTLSSLFEAVKALEGPAVLIIGEVAALAELIVPARDSSETVVLGSRA